MYKKEQMSLMVFAIGHQVRLVIMTVYGSYYPIPFMTSMLDKQRNKQSDLLPLFKDRKG